MAADHGINLLCFLEVEVIYKSKMARKWMAITINWKSEMVNEEHDCHSHISEPLFSNHSKTMMLKTKVGIHVFSAVEKNFFLTCYH